MLTLFFVALLLVHWQVSVFLQTFFLHRYGAHRQFTMTRGWERTFHLLTFLIQGPSYLNPRAYAILHRMHHAYSDTPLDPHSPTHQPNFFVMMWRTKTQYEDVKYRRVPIEPRFDGGYPEWPLLDDKLSNMTIAVAWGTVYALFYLAFAPHWWLLAFLPFHWLMGPVHGAIVNWAGHKIGYRNFDSDDQSKNTLVFDVLTMGELFQNNHHKWGQSPNFAVRAFEIDPAYQIMKVFSALGIIDMRGAQKSKWTGAERRSARPAVLAMPAPQDGP